MLAVISDPDPVSEEASRINQLFEAGLSVFHLRKPQLSAGELDGLLQQIDVWHHAKIALHQHHHLAQSYGIHRLHFSETRRKQTEGSVLLNLCAEGKRLSTSVHSAADYGLLPDCFHYAFLGPVFDSLSKKGYPAMDKKDRVIPTQKKQIRLIALGGITAANCQLPIQWGFDGIAVLGAVWQDPENAVKNFKILQAECPTIAR